MSVEEEQIIVELGDSSIAKLAKALNGGAGGAGGTGKKNMGGIAGMLQKITGGFAGGLVKLGLVLGGIKGIQGLVKMVVSSSPMLKQMLKLFNFGIMLILRPIGDFIGFMLRPVMIMLLRTFIIPFYKDFLPLAQDIGTFIGDAMVAFFEDPAKVIAEGLAGLNKWVTDGLVSIFSGEVNWTEIGDTIKTGMLTVLSNLPVVKIAEGIVSVIKQIDWSQIAADWDAVGVAFKNWFDNGIASIKLNLSSVATEIRNSIVDAIKKIPFVLQLSSIGVWVYNSIVNAIKNVDVLKSIIDFPSWIKNSIWNALQKVDLWQAFKDFASWIKDAIWNALKSAASGIGSAIGFANGGMINEPIFGIGKSGQAYTFGERGSEMVTPLSGGGGTNVNITVGSISSENDMREFERRVLEVIENANSRRGRV